MCRRARLFNVRCRGPGRPFSVSAGIVTPFWLRVIRCQISTGGRHPTWASVRVFFSDPPATGHRPTVGRPLCPYLRPSTFRHSTFRSALRHPNSPIASQPRRLVRRSSIAERLDCDPPRQPLASARGERCAGRRFPRAPIGAQSASPVVWRLGQTARDWPSGSLSVLTKSEVGSLGEGGLASP